MNTNSPRGMPDDLSTLVSCLSKARKDGYTIDFQVTEKTMTTPDRQQIYRPADVRVSNFYRFEGASDPSDSAILYLIETKDGRKGTLIDAYGMYADDEVSTFVKSISDVNKKTSSTRLNIFRMPLLLAFLSSFFALLSMLIKRPDVTFDPTLTAISLVLAAIYTVWIIIEVSRAKHLQFYQRMFWLILTLSVPFFGALLYQVMHQRRGHIVN